MEVTVPMRGMVGVAKARGEQRKDTVIVTMAIGRERSCSPEAVDGPDRAMIFGATEGKSAERRTYFPDVSLRLLRRI